MWLFVAPVFVNTYARSMLHGRCAMHGTSLLLTLMLAGQVHHFVSLRCYSRGGGRYSGAMSRRGFMHSDCTVQVFVLVFVGGPCAVCGNHAACQR